MISILLYGVAIRKTTRLWMCWTESSPHDLLELWWLPRTTNWHTSILRHIPGNTSNSRNSSRHGVLNNTACVAVTCMVLKVALIIELKYLSYTSNFSLWANLAFSFLYAVTMNGWICRYFDSIDLWQHDKKTKVVEQLLT